VPPRIRAAGGSLGRRSARPRLPTAHGLHPVRDHRSRRPAELAGDAGKRELEKRASGHHINVKVAETLVGSYGLPSNLWENRMGEELKRLIEVAKRVTPTPEHREEQRRSFAYGNTAYENTRITREMIDQQAEILASADAKRRT